MWTSQVRVLDDTAPAAWFEARLSGESGAVSRTVPDGYPANARILHSPRDGDGEWWMARFALEIVTSRAGMLRVGPSESMAICIGCPRVRAYGIALACSLGLRKPAVAT